MVCVMTEPSYNSTAGDTQSLGLFQAIALFLEQIQYIALTWGGPPVPYSQSEYCMFSYSDL